MSVWKNRDTWRYRIQRDGIVVAGSARTREEALALEARARTDLIDRRIGAAPRHTLPEAFAKYFSSAEALNLKSINTLIDKAGHWVPFVEGYRITDAVEVAERAASAWHTKGLKPATINRRLALMRRVLNLAYRRWGWLQQPLADKIEMLGGEVPRHVYLTPVEALRLRRAIRHPVARAWVSLLVYTGLRAGELDGLRADQVRDGVIYLDARTKTGKPRAIPVMHPATRYLKHIPLTLRYQGLRMHFQRAREAIGRPEIHLHDLRHTNAAWLAQAGAETRDLQVWLGHTNPATTARYAHLNLTRMETISRKLQQNSDALRKARRTKTVKSD